MKRSDHYAGNQVRFFLGELKNGTHPSKIKALAQFQNYIKAYKPNISDDNVDFLYTGNIDETSTLGLLHWCGVDSEKHDGQLKRICGPIITFLHWLVSYEEDSIYYDRFMRLPMDELLKINFSKHILRSTDNKLAITIPGHSRSGSAEDAFELLAMLLADHRNLEDDPEPIDIGILLNGSKACQDRFEEWLQKSNVEHINQTLAALKSASPASAISVLKRPTCWQDVTFKCLPLQEGEDDPSAEVEEDPEEPPPVADPMGLDDRDLRVTQDLYASGRLVKTALQKRVTMARISSEALTSLSLASKLTPTAAKTAKETSQEGVDEESDEEEEEEESPLSAVLAAHGKERRAIPSVLPGDKSFSVPLFLSLVHGSRSFEELQQGLEKLREYQRQQGNRRENLVRAHFGLFVQCADGLDWLKCYRKGISKVTKAKGYRRSSADAGQLSVGSAVDQGLRKLNAAQETLEIAKVEAKSTLAPILERMKQSREIRSAEKVLRGMSILLEYPHGMRRALEKGDLSEVVALYQRVQSIPSTSALKIVEKIKTAANEVIIDLQKQCYLNLLSLPSGSASLSSSSPSTSMLNGSSTFSTINKYATIMLSLEGSTCYIDLLRQAFSRQLAQFWEMVRRARDKFFVDVLEAYERGQEFDALAKTTPLTTHDRENLAVVIKKLLSTSLRLRKNTKGMPPQGSIKRNSFSGGSLSSRRSFTKGSTSSNQNGPLLMDDDLLESNDVLDDWEDSNGSIHDGDDDDDIASNRDSGFFSSRSETTGYGLDRGLISEEDEGLDDLLEEHKSYRDLLCSIVRKTFAQNLIDLSLSWFPLLYRIIFSMAQHQCGSSSPTRLPPPSASASGVGSQLLNSKGVTGGAAVGGLNKARSSTSSNRIFGATLSYVVDYIQLMAVGIDDPQRLPSLPSEVSGALSELDQYITSINALYSLKISANGLDAEMGPFSDAVREVLASNHLRAHLHDKEHRTILADCFVLYDTFESSMDMAVKMIKTQSEAIQQGSNKKVDKRAAGIASQSSSLFQVSQKTPFSASSFDQTGNALASLLGEMDFASPLSPYHDVMQMLALLAREEEGVIAQRTLDKILERSSILGDVFLLDLPLSSEGWNGNISGKLSLRRTESSNKIISPENGSLGDLVASSGSVESAVTELESLLLKGIDALREQIKRPEWVARIVFETIFQKVFSSFLDKMKRKMFTIEEARHDNEQAIPIQPSSASPSSKRSRKRSQDGGNGRSSMHQGQLVLQSLDEDLQYLEIGWSQLTGGGETGGKSKACSWMDFVRALIRIRSYSLPRVIRSALKVFPATSEMTSVGGVLPSSTSFASLKKFPSSRTITAPDSSATTSSVSLLNRLFAGGDDDDRPAAATGSAAATVLSAQSSGGTFVDRLLAGIEGKFGALRSSNDATSSAVLFSILPKADIVAQLEAGAVQRYLDYRSASLRDIIFSAYAYLSATESNSLKVNSVPDNCIPTHISRLLLIMYEEKRALTNCFANLTVKSGGGKEDFQLDKKAVEKLSVKKDGTKSLGGAADEREEEEQEEIKTIKPGEDKQLYAEYLFQAWTERVFDLYDELLRKLLENYFCSVEKGQMSGNVASTVNCPRSLRQALEDWQLLRDVLVEHGVDRSPNLSPGERALAEKGQCWVSADVMMSSGQLLALLL